MDRLPTVSLGLQVKNIKLQEPVKKKRVSIDALHLIKGSKTLKSKSSDLIFKKLYKPDLQTPASKLQKSKFHSLQNSILKSKIPPISMKTN